MTQNGKATTEKTAFSRTTSVATGIKADSGIIWKLLTNSADYARWNSTIISIDGNIAPGEKIQLRSKLAPKRTFKLQVRAFVPEQLFTWGDNQGVREYRLNTTADGITVFSMKEKIGGLMFPLYARYLPSFEQSFEQFAADLKKEAETIQQS